MRGITVLLKISQNFGVVQSGLVFWRMK
jgi:hypothetical protein